jgi:hypothetical protein
MTTAPTPARTTDGEPADDLVAEIVSRAQRPLEQATTLPARAYWDPDFYERELARIFRRDWLPVARLEQLDGPDTCVVVDIVGERLVLWRTVEGVRVTRGRCRQCGTRLMAQDPGTHTTRLRRADLSCACDAPDRADVRARVWHGFVLVVLDADADPPWAMEALDAALPRGYDLTDWRVVRTLHYPGMTGNWKVMLENALECYHHLGAHRDTIETLWPALGVVCADGSEGFRSYHARVPVSAEAAVGEVDGHLQSPMMAPPVEGLDPEAFSGGTLLFRFPILLVAANPDYSYWLQLLPTGPESHDALIHVLAPGPSPAADDPHHDAAAEMFAAIQDEDIVINAQVQASMRSEHAHGGILHPQEIPLLILQRYLAALLADG